MMTIYDYVMGYSDISYSDSWTMAISQRDVQNLWVQSPCWVDVGTSISTHTHWWTRKHGWLEFTYLKHVPRVEMSTIMYNLLQTINVCGFPFHIGILYRGFYIWINLWDLHLVTWLPEFSGAQVVEPPSASARRSQREAGILCHRWLLMTETLVTLLVA